MAEQLSLFDNVDDLPPLHLQSDSLLPEGGREEDSERALRLCEALAPGTGQMKMVVIEGEPASKSRPRFTRTGRVYRTKEDVDAELRTAYHVRSLFKEPWTGNIALGCVFFRPNKQRIDVDNMLKHVCDAANGIAWVDDSQVTAVYGVAELDSSYPRTILVFAQHRSTLLRGTDNVRPCEHCGKPFPMVGRTTKRFCGYECSLKAKGYDLSKPIPCKQCGKSFRRTTTKQFLCSIECRAASRLKVPRGGGDPSRCADCGKELSHRRGGRCRECWRANPNPKGK